LLNLSIKLANVEMESSAVGVTPYLLNTEYHTTLCESAHSRPFRTTSD